MFVYIRSTAFVIVVMQKLVLQQSKNITAKCTENLSPPPCILYLLEKRLSSVLAKPNYKENYRFVSKYKTKLKIRVFFLLD